MKKISVVVLFAFACNLAFAQVGDNERSSFQLSFISPVGTNGKHSAEYTNRYSLNLLVGISKNEEQLTLGGLSNIILNDAKGVQIAGLSNYVGNRGGGCSMGRLGEHEQG